MSARVGVEFLPVVGNGVQPRHTVRALTVDGHSDVSTAGLSPTLLL